MIKQILNRLPRKSHKSHDRRDGGNPKSSSKTNNDVTHTRSSSSKTKNDVTLAQSSSSNVPGSVVQPAGVNQPDNKPLQSQASKLNRSSTVSSTNDALPKLIDVPNSEKQNLFSRKLTLSGVVYDLTDNTKNMKEKEIKKQALMDLVDYIVTVNGKFPESVIQEIVKMVSANIFRKLTPQPRENKVLETFDGEEEEPCMDPQWPHLHLVYEFTLRFVASPETDQKVAKRYIDRTFVLKFLDLFDSEDPREREYLKFILHRMYGKFMVHRPYIRKSINNILFRFVFETEKHNGVAELLEILGSIINGFALPLKEEHKLFLVRALIPLHKPKCLPMYHQQLTYCITQFVEKDYKLADTIIRGLLRYWPITNSSKEVMFLSELEEVLEATQPPEFQRCMVPLFRQIARCLSSSHFQVAERALFLWNNDHIDNLIKQNRSVILPIIYPGLERNTTTHWNKAVQSLTLNVKKIFSDADPQLFEECSTKFKELESKKQESTSKREATWQRLEEVAAQRSAGSYESLVMSQKVIANHVSSSSG